MARRPAFAADGSLVAPAAHPIPDLLAADAATLRRRIAARELSSVELVTACLHRIEALNPTYNAVVSLRPREAVLAQAAAADAALARSERVGALHGLPIAIKDLAATASLRTTWGSPLFADHVPEYGLGSHTYNPVFGPTRNAYLPELSAGGSSGGAAVALALGMLPIADGSDFGGSLRNPGAWNTVFGLRPSQGRVPSVPAQDPFYGQLATNGPMGRSVADLAAMLTVMAGHDPRAPLSLETTAQPFEAALAPMEAPRIAWLGDLGGHVPFEPGILDLCTAALTELEPAGWQVEDLSVPFPWSDLWRAFVVLRHWAMSGRYGADYAAPERRALLKPEMIYEIEGGLALRADEVSAAAKVRASFYQAALGLFERFDALVLPTVQVFPFPIDWRWPKEIGGVQMDSYHRWMEIVVPGTMSGCPVVNLPAGFDQRGRPAGLQAIGRPRDDAGLLALAARYERDAARASG